jgi:hypothetical protein
VADQLYLSYWLRGFTEQNMLRHWEKALRAFPYSRLSEKASYLRIHAISYSEPVLLEEAFDPTPDVDAVLSAAREFQHADCAYQLETSWDLWQKPKEWHVTPTRVALVCFGSKFEDGDEHLRIECGLDAHYLPDPEDPESLKLVQSNIRSLLKLAHDLDDILLPAKRQLWSESGENFADRLMQAL